MNNNSKAKYRDLRSYIVRRFCAFSVVIAICIVSMVASASPQIPNQSSADDSLFPEYNTPLSLSHFTWGVDIGSSIDLGGNDMSSFDIDGIVGYKNAFWKTLGVGAGVHNAFGNNYTFIPVYAIMRSSFRTTPSLFFFEARAGYSFNTLSDSGSQGGLLFSLGCGVNLALYKGISSHIVLSYGYFGLKEASEDAGLVYKGNNINYAMLRIGVSF